MPSSLFITNLRAYKEKLVKKEVPAGYGTKLLADDILDPGNLRRAFDALPREIVQERVIKQFETEYLDLYKSEDFPRTSTQLLRDRVMLQACQDLLDEKGQISPDLLKILEINQDDPRATAEKVKFALLTAYNGFISGLLASIVGPEENKKMHEGMIKNIEGPVPRSAIISKAFNEGNDEKITDLSQKMVIAQNLKKLSNDISATNLDMLHYSDYLAFLIKRAIEVTPLMKKNQAILFWTDLMYIAQENGDYNTFSAIHEGLKAAGITSMQVPSYLLKEKFLMAEKLADPIARPRTPPPSSTSWKAHVEEVFSKDSLYQKYVENGVKAAQTELETYHKQMQAELKQIQTALPHLKAAQSPKTLLSFFSTDPYEVASEAIATVYNYFKKDRPSIAEAHKLATAALNVLNDIPIPQNKKSETAIAVRNLTVVTKHLRVACEEAYRLGERVMPPLSPEPVLRLRSFSISKTNSPH